MCLLIPGTIIISDSFSVYETLCEFGWRHRMVNHSARFVEIDNRQIHTETIEGLWKHMKDWMNTKGGTRGQHLQDTIDEWRFHHDYLSDSQHNFKFWKMLRVIALKGMSASILCNNQ